MSKTNILRNIVIYKHLIVKSLKGFLKDTGVMIIFSHITTISYDVNHIKSLKEFSKPEIIFQHPTPFVSALSRPNYLFGTILGMTPKLRGHLTVVARLRSSKIRTDSKTFTDDLHHHSRLQPSLSSLQEVVVIDIISRLYQLHQY